MEPAEREAVCDLLRSRPEWLRWVAEQVKRERSPGQSRRT